MFCEVRVLRSYWVMLGFFERRSLCPYGLDNTAEVGIWTSASSFPVPPVYRNWWEDMQLQFWHYEKVISFFLEAGIQSTIKTSQGFTRTLQVLSSSKYILQIQGKVTLFNRMTELCSVTVTLICALIDWLIDWFLTSLRDVSLLKIEEIYGLALSYC